MRGCLSEEWEKGDVYFESIEKVQELYLHSFVQRTFQDLFGAKRETVVLNEDIKSARELSENSEHV